MFVLVSAQSCKRSMSSAAVCLLCSKVFNSWWLHGRRSRASLEPRRSHHCHTILIVFASGVQFEYIQWTVECLIYSSFNNGALIFTRHGCILFNAFLWFCFYCFCIDFFFVFCCDVKEIKPVLLPVIFFQLQFFFYDTNTLVHNSCILLSHLNIFPLTMHLHRLLHKTQTAAFSVCLILLPCRVKDGSRKIDDKTRFQEPLCATWHFMWPVSESPKSGFKSNVWD